MRPVTPDEYQLVPLGESNRSEVGSPIPINIESSGSLPLVPLTQLPELDAASRGAKSASRGQRRRDASYRRELEQRHERKVEQRHSDNPEATWDELEEESEIGGAAWRIDTSDGAVWIEGDTILCACPDCGAPMSVRLWLMLAQCWRCETQIELTEEQQRAVEKLMSLRQQAATKSAPVETQSSSALASAVASPARSSEPLEVDRRPTPASARSTEAENDGASSTVRLRVDGKRKTRRLTPAWLISLVLHFILLLLLALLAISDYVDMESITLSSFVSTDDQVGGFQIDDAQEAEEVQFELPLPSDADLSDREELEEIEQANEDASEIREDDSPAVELPDMDLVREQITREASDRSHFVARDPRFRVELVRQEGGTTLTEAAVARGLGWLARFQNQDGSWSLTQYENSNRRSNRGDAAATALALLPFLGAGQTHEYGRYKETVSRGLLWLLDRQKENGDLRAGMETQLGMYAHGQAAIVLVEALALSGDERFRDPAQRAIDFIVDAQHEQGGWRYRPGQEGDTSVLGWQMMALQSARSPGVGLEVPDTTMQLAEYYLDLSSAAEGALYGYQPSSRNRPTETMTAEALLCRMYLGWRPDDPRVIAGLQWVAERKRPSRRDKNIYYWYYATQAFHNYGGRLWDDWNEEIRDVLVDLQVTSGRHAGSWSPSGFEYGDVGERIYVTALAVCTLEVYYRHLPIFRQIELDDTTP